MSELAVKLEGSEEFRPIVETRLGIIGGAAIYLRNKIEVLNAHRSSLLNLRESLPGQSLGSDSSYARLGVIDKEIAEVDKELALLQVSSVVD